MSLRKDDSAISEIVGALLLVLVVSSAAFGFGLFLHDQAELTQQQKAAEKERQLESLEVLSIAPVSTDFADADCVLDAGAADWNSLAITVASRHLKDSLLEGITVNGLQVKQAKVGASTYDFTKVPGDPGYVAPVVKARDTATLLLENVADNSAGCEPAFSFAGVPPTVPPLPTTAGIEVRLLTALTNTFERAFIPPSPLAALEPTPGVANSFTLVGTGSVPGTADAFLVKWEWKVVEAVDPAVADCTNAAIATPTGHRAQVGTDTLNNYCVQLTVTDNNGLTGTTRFSFDP